MQRKRKWYRRLAVFCASIFMILALVPETVHAALVADRVKAVTKTYPGGSYYNGYMTVEYVKNGIRRTYIGHECAGFVMYVTDRAFQKAYYNGSPDYRKIYKTVSTKNTKEMKSLFARAKIGDVIRWTGRGGRHQAIFLGADRRGVQVYEANFGDDYNRVWYAHMWPWNNKALWTDTSSSVSVFRYRDYEKIDRAVKKVSLNRKSLLLRRGKRYRLTAAVRPSTAYNKKIQWKSSDPKIAKVDARGNVKGIKKGHAVITALARDGSGKKASCRVTVR